jgi:2-polyprenyl-3-methyl-5-hydroxy-6-metoxy-1,4-benzoquinol methylase
MELKEIDEKLSSQSYWDDVLKNAKLPRINNPNTYLYSITMKYADKFLSKSEYKTFFEVGCGSSGWLPYFANEYRYLVSGLDYSEVGCELAKKNLDLLNIKYGDIYCKDFFQPLPTEGKKYDVVFSYGVIEHFSEPEKIIKIFDTFLNDGGVMITLVPNFKGLIGRLTKIFIKDVYDIHNIIDPEQLESYHTANNLVILRNGYAGIFAFGVMPLVKSNHWLLRSNTFRRQAMLLFIKAFDKIAGAVFKSLPFDLSSRLFSPYLICIAKKNGYSN